MSRERLFMTIEEAIGEWLLLDDPEACPGCGCKPGDGITDDCDDPGGCGYFKEWEAAAS